MSGDNIRTDAIELLCTKDDFFELMDDNAKLCEQVKAKDAEIERLRADSAKMHSEIRSMVAAWEKSQDEIERLKLKVEAYKRYRVENRRLEAEIERLRAALRLIYTWNASGDYQRDLFRMKDFAIAALEGEK